LLTAKAANGCTAVGTVILTVNDSCLVYWPNVFTPDGDGTNDTFYLLTFPCVERIVSFDIYNRWGDIVYSRTDLPPNDAASGWNGRTNDGADFPADVLLWTAKVRYYNGKTGVFNGAITLLR
jgi:gliding motility-associated-like protein